MPDVVPPRDSADGAILVVAHPPERRGRGSVMPAQAGPGCCTCCCCCCLHTVGGIIGATVLPLVGRSDTKYRRSDDRTTPAPWAVVLFWLISLILMFIALVLLAGSFGSGSSKDGILIAGIIILLVFPALQLGAVILSAILLPLVARSSQSYQYGQLGKITVGLIAGTFTGLLIMSALLLLFTALNR
jgi:hypothetical protein